eukprot:Skav204289  [mRNA]  locus=scaffold409:396505:399789:- [translate_table: standard]
MSHTMSSGYSQIDSAFTDSDRSGLAGESAATDDLSDSQGQTDETSCAVGDDDDVKGISSELSKYQSVYEQTFDKIQMPPDVLQEIGETLQAFIATQSGSRESAGDAIFTAIFEAGPSLQTLFKSPRPVMALKFCTALVSLINAAPKPGALKTAVETIGFQHLDVETWSQSEM